MNHRVIRNILGWILLFEAAFLLIPTLTAVVYREREVHAFLISIALCGGVGGLFLIGRMKTRVFFAKEGFVAVALAWIVLSLFGALPFWLSGAIPSYLDAVFETVSGFTTTGASILADVENFPRSLLMWRSFTHWIGGMGVLVFIMAFLPLSGAQNMHLMRAESPGPEVGKLVPRVRQTALILYGIYIAMTLVQVVLMLCGGASVFDALNISFATAGTGGFGIKNDSMASYSTYLQIVVTVFMLLFSLNFGSYYLLLQRRPREAFTTEIRAFLLIVLVATALIAFNIRKQTDSPLLDSAFTVASLISTTGFAVGDFALWPQLSQMLLLLVMFIGACAGSTGGGIKVSRVVIWVKSVRREIHRMLHPNKVMKIHVDRRPIEAPVVHAVNTYLVCYVLIFAASVLLLSLDGHSFTTNFSAVAATVNNVGPGLDAVGPTANFGFFSPLSKLVLIFDMLAGRLELFPILLLLSPSTYKKL